MTAVNASIQNAQQKACMTCGASIHAKAEICPSCGVRQRTPVSKTTLLLLTFFLGGIGGHKFYLGKTVQGVLYLLLCWTGIPGLLALIEFIIYACTSSERLNEKYEASSISIILLIVLPFILIAIIGILAAIAIPAYSDYTKKAKVQAGLIAGQELKVKIQSAFMDAPADMSCTQQNCPMGPVDLTSARFVKQVSSDRTGQILIEFDQTVFPAEHNTLAITPMIAGRPADLSDPANANQTLTWQCGRNELTTVLERNLPKTCR